MHCAGILVILPNNLYKMPMAESKLVYSTRHQYAPAGETEGRVSNPIRYESRMICNRDLAWE